MPRADQSGLTKYLYRDRRPDAFPVRTSIEDKEINFSWTSEEEKPLYSPFCVTWEGYIEITEAGRYSFFIESDDGSELWIDDHQVVDNSGSHATEKKGNTIFMERGQHSVRLTYFDVAGDAAVHWTWIRPGAAEETVPTRVLFHKGSSIGQ